MDGRGVRACGCVGLVLRRALWLDALTSMVFRLVRFCLGPASVVPQSLPVLMPSPPITTSRCECRLSSSSSLLIEFVIVSAEPVSCKHKPSGQTQQLRSGQAGVGIGNREPAVDPLWPSRRAEQEVRGQAKRRRHLPSSDGPGEVHGSCCRAAAGVHVPPLG